MKNKITLKEFFESNERLAIHCDTKEKANKLLKEFDKLGKTWWGGKSYLEDTYFFMYKDNTYYTNDGYFCGIKYCKEKGHKTYSFEDIIFEENEPKNLIPEIAKMLGVEVGEEFGVSSTAGRFKFDNEWLLENGEYPDSSNTIRINAILAMLLNGSSKIKKLPKKPQLTDAERVILENLPKEYKWIVRDDEDNDLFIYETKPTKNDHMYKTQESYCNIHLFNHLFQFIKWEDEEPYNIEELLKGE